MTRMQGEHMTISMRQALKDMPEEKAFPHGQALLRSQSLVGATAPSSAQLVPGENWAGTMGDDVHIGTDGDDTLDGVLGADSLVGGQGNDIIAGGAGNDQDTLVGGLGDDSYYVDDLKDIIIEIADEGHDIVNTYIDFTLPGGQHIEILTGELAGNAALKLAGNEFDNEISGTGGKNTLSGGDGADTLRGFSGDDILSGDEGADVLNGGIGADTLRGGSGIDAVSYIDAAGPITANLSNSAENAGEAQGDVYEDIEDIYGSQYADKLIGNDLDNTLEGDIGADTLNGGGGRDFASYAHATISVTANLDNPSQNVGHAEGDVYQGIEGLIGSIFADILAGNNNDNTLDGGQGEDTLAGGQGDDVFMIDTNKDKIIELGSQGYDTVIASVSFSLAAIAHVEVLRAAAGDAAIDLTGNDGGNKLIGNNGGNILDGALGGDWMAGGKGDDIYVVDDIADAVIETAGEGADEVRLLATSGLTRYVLADNVERLSAISFSHEAGFSLTGNALNNRIVTDNEGSDSLDGGLGADTMVGGAGNDVYYVDHVGDEVVEENNDTLPTFRPGMVEVTDTVVTAINYGLGTYLENLTAAAGKSALRLIGNELDNVITGNSGNNMLIGGMGKDTLSGGAGNDTYIIDGEDQVFDTSGVDTVTVSFTYALSNFMENVRASGSSAIDLTGNRLSNVITGNGGANKLYGGWGHDTLKGGTGRDTFVFNTRASAGNSDRIVDYKVKDDTIWLDNKYYSKLGSGSLNKPGKLKRDFFTIGQAKDKKEHLIYDSETGYLSYDTNGSDEGGAVKIVQLSKGLKLSHDEFRII